MSNIPSFNIRDIAALGMKSSDEFTSPGQTKKLGQTDFLKLLATQLANQDPTKPRDSSQFATEMAQFGTVDGITSLNKNMSALLTSFQSNQALQASSLVGRQVLVNNAKGHLAAAGNVTGEIEVPKSAQDIQLVISNDKKDVIRTVSLGDHKAGMMSFNWDGLDSKGQRMPEGSYTLVAKGTVDGKEANLRTYNFGNVGSVTIDNTGTFILNLDGERTVTLNQVREIKN